MLAEHFRGAKAPGASLPVARRVSCFPAAATNGALVPLIVGGFTGEVHLEVHTDETALLGRLK